VVRNSFDIGLLSSRQEESRVKVDHHHAIVLSFPAAYLAKHFVRHVTWDVVEVPGIGVRQDHGTPGELAVENLDLSEVEPERPGVQDSQGLQSGRIGNVTDVNQNCHFRESASVIMVWMVAIDVLPTRFIS
jgi:hypothetical protein